MSEPLLKALINLFAIIAKVDSVTEDERNSINTFLHEHLSDVMSAKYMTLFDELTAQSNGQDNTSVSGDELEEVARICKQINMELTQQQKLVLLLELLELVIADGEVSEGELKILDVVVNSIKIDPEVVEEMKNFVLGNQIKSFNSRNVLLITASAGKVGKEVKVYQHENIDGFLAFLKLPKTENYFVKYLGNQSLTLNGLPLRNNITAVFSTGSSIRSEKLNTIYYSDIVSRFMTEENSLTISFEAKDIHFRFPNGGIGLRKINFCESRGQLIGLMGASGSGKSTLLNVLNGNETPTHGLVKINGVDIHKNPEKIKGIVGYVPQDDLLIEELSVYQNLYFAAKLCFSNKSKEELDQLVNKTLAALGLTETRDLKVGSPLEKTISGGQRKRLNIGLELLREPSVLYVDEPTSGLSSRDSENIMDLLKELSLKGKMVFVVIHQPSSDIFKMFDKLAIMDVGGYQIFYGNPVEAVVYFKRIIDTVDKDQGACLSCGNVNPEQIFNIIETRVVNEYGRLTDERKISPKKWNEYFEEKIDIKAIEGQNELPKPNLNIPNWFKQIGVFTRRDFLSKLSNRQYLIINLLEAPLLAALLAFIIRYYPEHESGEYILLKNMNVPAFYFMSIIVALFMGLTMSAEEIIKDRKILKRESFLHLSRSSYLLSKITILFGFSAVQTFAYVMIGDLILEIDGMSATYWAILFSTSCFANLLGLNISSAFNSAITIYILIPILLIPQLILSGVVVKFDNLNPQITTTKKVPMVGEVMASRWAFEAYMVSQYKYNQYNRYFYPIDKERAQAEYMTVYYIPELDSRLSQAYHNMTAKNNIFKENLEILRNEIKIQLDIVGYDKFEYLHRLNPEDFDEWLYNRTKRFLEVLKKLYNSQYNELTSKKEKAIFMLTNTPEKKERFDYLKNNFYNEAVAEMVRNTNDPNRIIAKDGYLVQKVFPIYMDPIPEHMLDFRTQFFTGKKHFLGYYFDTLYFNITIIWLMTLCLYMLLYFDVLRKILKKLGAG